MSSLHKLIEDTLQAVGAAQSSVDARQGERVFNMVFPTQAWTQFHQHLPVLLNRLKERGYSPRVASFAQLILGILKENPIVQAKIRVEHIGSFSHLERNRSLFELLSGSKEIGSLSLESPIVRAILSEIEEAGSRKNGVLILTETECIHPILRVSAFEQVLQGRFSVPTIICYPGERGLGENPSFLGLHRSDGNYRSTHIY